MVFDGRICLFGCLRLGKEREKKYRIWVFETWDQVPESSGPPLTIYQEKFHLPNHVILP